MLGEEGEEGEERTCHPTTSILSWKPENHPKTRLTFSLIFPLIFPLTVTNSHPWFLPHEGPTFSFVPPLTPSGVGLIKSEGQEGGRLKVNSPRGMSPVGYHLATSL